MIRFLVPVAAGAVIGYVTNWLAIKMLFWPRREYRLAGVRIPFTPGLFVKRRADFTKSISLMVESRFATADDLVAAVYSAHDQGVIHAFLEEMGPIFKMGWNLYCNRMQPGDFKRDMEKLVTKLHDSNIVAKTLGDKLDAMPVVEIENLVMAVSSRELSAITWLGALLGAMIGAVQGLF